MNSVVVAANLQKAERSHVVQALAAFKGVPADTWLPQGHPAATGMILKPNGKQYQSFQSMLGVVGHQRLVEAVATTGPNHCLDGWSYLARALMALLSGDQHAARHLSYYAQLRAGLSILANLGIGVFNGINFVIDANGQAHRMDMGQAHKRGAGTHKIVWDALSDWAADSALAAEFLDLVRIRGVSLLEALRAIWPSTSAASVASRMIDAWGLDLKRGKDDRECRNTSSYNPHLMNSLQGTLDSDFDFVEEVWNLLEPTGGASYDFLDRHLLRSLLWSQHAVIHQNTDYSSGAIELMYGHLDPSIQSVVSKDFLLGKVEPNVPLLVREARSSVQNATATAMASRAVLLLRTATALTQASLEDAGLNATGDRRAWLDKLAEARGFWAMGTPVTQMADMWEDLLSPLEKLRDSRVPPPTSLADWFSRDLEGLPVLAQAERIALWGLSA